MNEPVALRYDFDGNGYLYMDAGSGSDWASRVKDCEFLYTHPMRELTDEDILSCIDQNNNDETNLYDFARAILKKARKK